MTTDELIAQYRRTLAELDKVLAESKDAGKIASFIDQLRQAARDELRRMVDVLINDPTAIASEDPTIRFIAQIRMTRKMAAAGDIAEAVRWIAQYRRDFRGNISDRGHRIH